MACGIYKIENLINGKIYIGQSVDIQYRFSNHKSESFNPKSNAYDTAIHRAIRKYGVNNFSFEIVEECKQEQLSEREIYWIDYFHSFGNGYNLTTGGEGVPATNIKEAQKLWDDGLSVKEISTMMHCKQHTIIRILESYDNYNSKESYKRGRVKAGEKLRKPVMQYDKNGNFIKRYSSITEAATTIGTNHSTLSESLGSNNRFAVGGYQWTYEGEEPPGVYNPRTSNEKKPVLQLDKQGNIVAEYASVSDAIRAVGLKNLGSISRCCDNKQCTAGGYCWKWKYSNKD